MRRLFRIFVDCMQSTITVRGVKLAIAMGCAAAAMLLLSCSRGGSGKGMRSVYYWSTVLDIDSVKQRFLEEHGVGRMYIRYFDVVPGDDGRPVPNATLRFRTGVPGGIEAVPTVYIVNDCMAADTAGLAEKTFRRVMQMSETNGVSGVREVQVDCDWTRRTRGRYFGFLRTLAALARGEGVEVSATIRLHQLAEAPPPVSRGVLMMYNTGDFTDITCQKPILDMADAAPYLRHLRGYALPLATAYPIYSWRILFRRGRYVGIMHRDDDLPVMPGDSIVTRTPTTADIMEAARAVTGRKPGANGEVILFDLSKQNITRYKPEDYEKIYNCGDI